MIFLGRTGQKQKISKVESFETPDFDSFSFNV